MGKRVRAWDEQLFAIGKGARSWEILRRGHTQFRILPERATVLRREATKHGREILGLGGRIAGGGRGLFRRTFAPVGAKLADEVERAGDEYSVSCRGEIEGGFEGGGGIADDDGFFRILASNFGEQRRGNGARLAR